MDAPELTPDLTKRLDGIEAYLPGCNPLDANEMALLSRQLMELRSLVESRGTSGAVGICDLAQRVVQHVARHGVVGPREALELVTGLLTEVRGGFRAAGEDVELQAELEAMAPVTREIGLQLIDGRKLGEILVSLSMLTPVDVERALKTQKMTGKRFGEALIDLGLLSREAILSALNIQRKRRGSGWSDPWAEKKKV
jgi:hypothetical protein